MSAIKEGELLGSSRRDVYVNSAVFSRKLKSVMRGKQLLQLRTRVDCSVRLATDSSSATH